MGIKRHTEKSLAIVCTDMEISYRKKTFPDSQSIISVKHKICCTACGRNLQKEVQTGLLCTHPAMEVILCKECLEFYGDGLYKTDKKGDDVYCRWCAQGGTIYCCSKCSVAFCKKCIDRNLKTDKKVMTDINKDTWACFICVSKPLWYLRALHWAVQKYKKDLLADSRKRKLSTSSIESGTLKTSKPGPASAKKALLGPASAKKAKLEESIKKPGPASSKRPGPASLTKTKVIDISDDDKPIQTRHKKIDYSPKIEFPIDDTPKRRSTQRKKPTPASKAKNTKKGKKPAKKRKFLSDASSDEEFDDFEDQEDDDSAVVDDEAKEPIERAMEHVLDFCFKLSNNFNTKLIKYQAHFKGNLTTSDKFNSACSNLHMDLKKIVRLYNAIDEKMMNQLDVFNAAQQALEADKLALEESVLGDIDCDEYGIDPKTPPEPEVILPEIDDYHQDQDETMKESNPIDINAESDERAKDEEQTDKIVEDGEESQEYSAESKVNEVTVENGVHSNEEIPEKLDEVSKEKESEEEKDDKVSEENKESQPVSEPVVAVNEENKESQLEKELNSEPVLANEKHDEINDTETNVAETDKGTKPEKSTDEAMDIEEVGNKPAESDANEISSDARSSDLSEQSKDSENSKNDVDSITLESTSTENKEDDKTDIEETFNSEVDSGERTENQNKDETIGTTDMELDNNEAIDVKNGIFDEAESRDDFSAEKADDQKQDEPREFETGPVKNGEAKDNEEMEVDANELKDVHNGSKDKVDEADGLSDISDKSDCFTDFDKVATKDSNFPTPSAATPSN
uniref:Transcriptional regulator ATRX n=2 Tax=Cacopsylla melanoneura TaxID=428564 RepID=A0A8D8V3V8_9HEMI